MTRSILTALACVLICLPFIIYVGFITPLVLLIFVLLSIGYVAWDYRRTYNEALWRSIRNSREEFDGYVLFVSHVLHTQSVPGLGSMPNLVVVEINVDLLSDKRRDALICHEVGHIRYRHGLIAMAVMVMICHGFFTAVESLIFSFVEKKGVFSEEAKGWACLLAYVLLASAFAIAGWPYMTIMFMWPIACHFSEGVLSHICELEADRYVRTISPEYARELALYFAELEPHDHDITIFGLKLGFPIRSHPKTSTRIKRLNAVIQT